MADQEFNPIIQTKHNGPLTSDFQKRIVAAKEKHHLGYWNVAELAGFSGSFLGNITRYEVNVGTPTANRLATVIEQLEASPKGSDVASLMPTPNPAPKAEVTKPVTPIAAAKQALADALGVKLEAIEITIRA